MASPSFLYHAASDLIARGGFQALPLNQLHAALLRPSYEARPAHRTLGELASHELAAEGYTRQRVEVKVVDDKDGVRLVALRDAVLFGDDVASGEWVGSCVLFARGSSDAASTLIGVFGFPPVPTAGSAVSIGWPATGMITMRAAEPAPDVQAGLFAAFYGTRHQTVQAARRLPPAPRGRWDLGSISNS
jgi:hypothetical protein